MLFGALPSQNIKQLFWAEKSQGIDAITKTTTDSCQLPQKSRERERDVVEIKAASMYEH